MSDSDTPPPNRAVSPGRRRPVVLMVCSRAIPSLPESGRERTMRFVHDALERRGNVVLLQFPSALERRSIWQFVKIAKRWLAGVVSGRSEPLQSLLFWDSIHLHNLRRQVKDLQPDAVYFDGVRTGIYLPLLRRAAPELRLICDFDDLMSARMAGLAGEGQPASLGYLSRYVPDWLVRGFVEPLARRIPRYEAKALVRAESQIMAAAQAVVLVSSVDAQTLRAQVEGPASIEVIPPVMPVPTGATPAAHVDRFVFIGTDGLLQNRKTIEYLVALWQRFQPETTLHIYGRQKGGYGAVPGIIVHGFVANIGEVYSRGSVLLAPSYVSGGVKTKVLEAMAHGVVVVGTRTTFEGIEGPTEGLVLDDDGIEALVRRPMAMMRELSDTARAVNQAVQRFHGIDTLGERWRSVVWPLATSADHDESSSFGSTDRDAAGVRIHAAAKFCFVDSKPLGDARVSGIEGIGHHIPQDG